MQVKGHVFLQTAYAKRMYWYVWFRTWFPLGLSHTPTSPNPSPFVRTRKSSTSAELTRTTSQKTQRGLRAKELWAAVSVPACVSLTQPLRVEHGRPREQGQRRGARRGCWAECGGRAELNGSGGTESLSILQSKKEWRIFSSEQSRFTATSKRILCPEILSLSDGKKKTQGKSNQESKLSFSY